LWFFGKVLDKVVLSTESCLKTCVKRRCLVGKQRQTTMYLFHLISTGRILGPTEAIRVGAPKNYRKLYINTYTYSKSTDGRRNMIRAQAVRSTCLFNVQS